MIELYIRMIARGLIDEGSVPEAYRAAVGGALAQAAEKQGGAPAGA